MGGDAAAQRDMFEVYFKAHFGVKQDLPQAILWLRRGAMGGDALAQLQMGSWLVEGKNGLQQDKATATRFLEQ